MAKSNPTVISTQAETPGSKGGKRRLLSILVTSGLVLIVGSCCLCGGLVYTQWPEFESDPAAAVQLTEQMLPITVPENFTPMGTIHWDIWMFLSMRGAYYSLTNGEGELSFLEVDSGFIDNVEFREHVKQSLREHGAGGGFDLVIKQEEQTIYNVAGKPVAFNVIEAKDRTTDDDFWLADGIVEGNNGPVMISLWIDEEHWDPRQVEALIESIGSQ